MEYFIEGVLELLFSLVKTKPEKKPDNDTRILFYIFVALFFILFLLYLFLFSIRYDVTTEQIQETSCFFLRKAIKWNDISCVRTIEKEDDSNLIIALYNRNGNCVADISTDMKNAWYIVAMAEHKNIEIREEKKLTIKQIKKL